jgi:hypothetical protein
LGFSNKIGLSKKGERGWECADPIRFIHQKNGLGFPSPTHESANDEEKRDIVARHLSRKGSSQSLRMGLGTH